MRRTHRFLTEMSHDREVERKAVDLVRYVKANYPEDAREMMSDILYMILDEPVRDKGLWNDMNAVFKRYRDHDLTRLASSLKFALSEKFQNDVLVDLWYKIGM